MADQIEKVMATNGDTGIESVPIATNDSPGIASFSKDDFLVDSQGKVEALTKWGIAHILNYRGVNDVARMYNITTSFGKQLPKVGDVGLVLSDEVNSSVNDVDTQIGKIVRLTAIQMDATAPIIYYGENLGSIAGPQGPKGVTGEIGKNGAIQLIIRENSIYNYDVLYNFNADGKVHVGDSGLVTVTNTESHVGQLISVSKISPDGRIESAEHAGNIRGPQGTKFSIAARDMTRPGTAYYYWKSRFLDSVLSLKVGDYVIANTDGDSRVPNGAMFEIIAVEQDGKIGVSYGRPDLYASTTHLGIWALYNAVIGDDGITFDYNNILEGHYAPQIGELGLCMDDSDNANFGKLYTITSVVSRPSTHKVTTDLVGVDLRGPVQDISLGTVTTVPNDKTGAAGQASASMIDVDRLNKRLNLSIPVGPQGKQGIQGAIGPQGIPGTSGVANVNSKGTYDPAIAYVQNDLVYFDTQYTTEAFGGSYIRTGNLPGEVGLTPKDNPTAWGLFVAEGAPGKNGQPGPVGPAGVPGAIQCVLGSMSEASGKFSVLYKVDNTPISTQILGLVTVETKLSDSITLHAGDIITGMLSDGLTNLFTATSSSPLASFGAAGMFQHMGYNYDGWTLLYSSKILAVGDKVLAVTSPTMGVTSTPGTLYRIDSLTPDGEILATTQLAYLPIESFITILNPSTATNGTLTPAQFESLQQNPNCNIIFDKEIYHLQDQGHDAGYNVYTHVGPNSQDRFVIKCITVNTNDKSWVLTEHSLGNNAINLGDDTASQGSLTEAEWNIINDNPDAIIKHGNDVYRYAHSDRIPEDPRHVFVCVTWRKFENTVSIEQSVTKYIICVSSAGYQWKRSVVLPPKPKYLHRFDIPLSPIEGSTGGPLIGIRASVISNRPIQYLDSYDPFLGGSIRGEIVSEISAYDPNNSFHPVLSWLIDIAEGRRIVRFIVLDGTSLKTLKIDEDTPITYLVDVKRID